MANITAAEVNKLRQQTGAGMMDCKNALVEADGDYEKAIDILRKKGQKVANKRADRSATEGRVIGKLHSDGNFGAIVMLNCETDFVAKNEEFGVLANAIIDLAIANKVKSIEELRNMTINGRTVAENIMDMVGKTGEKMELGDYQVIEAPTVLLYNHMTGKLASIAGFSKANAPEQPCREVVMQIAAMSPIAIDKDDVDAKTIEHEIEIGKDQAREEGKPEEMLEKIALGKLNKFFKENTLLNQDFIREPKKTVRQHLEELDKDLKVTAIRRVALG
jgi:elongation factor Ts